MALIGPAQSASYGLVVGIDRYQNIPRLEGAVNDSEDIAAALRGAGFDEVLHLKDEAASRAAILEAWAGITARARPGDTVVFTYAGHGGQEPESLAGSEEDGEDEVFMLAGFDERRPGNAERIRDDEIYGMFAGASQINIIFVADSCHSGTMTRSFDMRSGAGKTRQAGYGPIEDDSLPPPAAAAPRLEENLEHVTFFGAVEDSQVVHEVSINGTPRGAMSWAFARAMRGAADRDGNLRLNSDELELYLRETVRIQTEGRQLPRMAPRGRPQRDLLTLALKTDAGDADSPIRLHGAAAAPAGAVLVASASEADLVWDAETGEVISATGDIVARLGKGNEAGLGPIVAKWQALRIVRRLAERQPLSGSLRPDSSIHHQGDILDAVFTDPAYGSLTLFNLANDGTLQMIAPGPDPGDARYNGRIAPATPVKLPVQVTPPFGMDHVVAIVSPEPLADLVEILTQHDGKPVAQPVLDMLARLRRADSIQAAIVSIITGPR